MSCCMSGRSVTTISFSYFHDAEETETNQALEAMAALLQASAYSGDADTVREILERGTVRPDSADSELTTPLMLASAAGNIDCVKLLVEFGAYINAKRSTGTSSLFLAAQGGHLEVVRFLFDVGAVINSQSNSGATPLLIASQTGRVDVVRYLCSKGANIHLPMKDKTTPLFVAAQNGHELIVRQLASNGADINCRREDGTTPLWIACQMGHVKVVQTLLDLGVDFDKPRNDDGVTPLFKAASKGFRTIAEYLLKKKPNLGLQKSGYSPLHAAAYFGHLGVVQLMMEHGAKADLKDKDGFTPAELSAKRGYDSVSRIIFLQQNTVY